LSVRKNGGRSSGATAKLILRASENKYVASLKDCNFALVLTTKDFKMQNEAYEAMGFERPIITSD